MVRHRDMVKLWLGLRVRVRVSAQLGLVLRVRVMDKS